MKNLTSDFCKHKTSGKKQCGKPIIFRCLGCRKIFCRVHAKNHWCSKRELLIIGPKKYRKITDSEWKLIQNLRLLQENGK